MLTNSAALHVALLALWAGYLVHVSWRRWPDLIVDFGRELYTAWRLSDGAVLYRDVDSFYGPLSSYLNAGLFQLFGPGVMVLAVANMCVLGAIVVLAYFLFRAAWNAVAAVASVAVFITLFSVSRFTLEGSFNFIAPYSHETTHGLLVLLILTAVLFRWSKKPRSSFSLLAGGLFGLTLVLKPEFILAGACLLLVAAIQGWREMSRKPVHVTLWAFGALAPTALFAVYFSQHLPFAAALNAASRAWLNVIGTSRYVSDPAQLKYSGLDAPFLHLVEHVQATAFAVAVLGVIAAAGWFLGRMEHRQTLQRIVFAVTVCGTVLLAARVPNERSIHFGRALLGLLLVYGVFVVLRARRPENPITATEAAPRHLRTLLAVVGATMMARMALNGRAWQFGYYQAALATMVIIAVVISELPRLVTAKRFGQLAITALIFGAILPPVWSLSRENVATNRAVDHPIGAGRDLFFVPPASVTPISDTATRLVGLLSARSADESLLVLPEGIMLNYLTRMRSPLPYFFYYSAVTEGDREKQVVAALKKKAPTWVVVIDRKLGEYGIRYGERSGAGADILRWVSEHYEPVGNKDGRPLELKRDGLIILRRKSGPPLT